jgi:hypothetical protein
MNYFIQEGIKVGIIENGKIRITYKEVKRLRFLIQSGDVLTRPVQCSDGIIQVPLISNLKPSVPCSCERAWHFIQKEFSHWPEFNSEELALGAIPMFPRTKFEIYTRWFVPRDIPILKFNRINRIRQIQQPRGRFRRTGQVKCCIRQ